MAGTEMKVVVALLALALAVSPEGAAPAAAQDQAGKALYDKNCAQCHGEKGDGKGVAAPHLMPRPRDFTSGKFKIRTTASGKLPTDADLHHIIKVGMPYTSMPAWPNLTDAQIDSLVQYVKSFYPDFAKPEAIGEAVQIPTPPPLTEESVARGQKTYAELGCAGCHGELGRMDGPTAPTLKDDAGYPIRTADLSRPWTFRGGARRGTSSVR
jgi:cytochrome c oxidase cbb3-type subunit 2